MGRGHLSELPSRDLEHFCSVFTSGSEYCNSLASDDVTVEIINDTIVNTKDAFLKLSNFAVMVGI
ncbi:MAG: hypothetical protein N5P05_004169 (plasmid) [Chroococcopsis gigantea SAG 12.99]|nr:hypothetical protein [Chroococcopsis gigantea SAG 12.99]